MCTNPKYLSAFADLGPSNNVKPEVIDAMEDFVCRMYGIRGADVNIARFELFKKLYAPKKGGSPMDKIKSTDPCVHAAFLPARMFCRYKNTSLEKCSRGQSNH